jgi:dephospho-CoA kinase
MPSDPSPMRVALTGGIATGKSHCLRAFAALGVQTLDSDLLAREAVRPGTAGLEAVLARFGRGLVRPDGTLDRAALGRIVFADPAARRDLEAIIHPLVYAAIQTRVGSPSRTPNAPEPEVLSIADIPLLYESGHAQDFDRVVVAACRPDQQLQRLMARDGFSEADARQRIGTQLPIGVKAERADYVIDTSGPLADTDRQVVEVFERLRAEALSPRPFSPGPP